MPTPPEQPHLQLVMLSRSYVISRAIQSIASLDIADHMSDDPIDINTLAAKTGTNPSFLERILDFLSAYGLFSKNEKGFALTALSKPLQTNDPHSVKDILNMVDNTWWEAFAYLDKGLKT